MQAVEQPARIPLPGGEPGGYPGGGVAMNEELQHRHPRIGRGRLRATHESGSLVELQDSSRWLVPTGHEIYTRTWTDESEVTVVPGDFAGYPYDLIHASSGDRVPARYLGYGSADLGWSLLDE
jgi:hypothetical protein